MTSEKKQVYKVYDLVGCRVFTETGEELGHLMDVLPTGGNDVYVVRKDNREYMLPALRSVVTRISIEERRIEVKLPPGLRELYEGL